MKSSLVFALILAVILPALAVEKPNIIFILSDHLAHGDLGYYEASAPPLSPKNSD